MNEEPLPIVRFNEKVTPEIERIVAKALVKDRDRRYQHIDDLLADLKSVRRQLESGAISTKSVSPHKVLKIPWYVYASVAILVTILILSKLSNFATLEKPITSVAVLPFQNISNDPEQEYFSDGMTEALISELSKIKALRVISRTSVMRFKKTDKSLPEIANELGVDAVVEGSVQRAQNNVRITAQLVKAQPEQHLWANDFTRAFQDILILQSEVARAISREIKITVTPEERERLAMARTVNPEAHEAYLKGMFYVNKISPPDVMKGIDYLSRAIEIDSTYALAYAGLGIAYDWLASFSVQPPKETWSKVRLYATKALHFDETLAEGYMLLGDTKLTYDWDFKGAEEYFKRAIELNPNLDIAHDFYASFLSSQRRFDEAIREVKIGRSLDPLSATAISMTAAPYVFAENADSALLYINEALAIDSTHSFANRLLGGTYLGQGKYKEAITILQKMISRGDSSALDVLAAAYAISGQESKARELLDELTKLSKTRYVSPDLGVWAYCALGDTARLFECLEKGYEERSSGMVFLAVQPPWCDFLQRDPRYQAMLRKVGLER